MLDANKRRGECERGFSLTELIITIAIMGVMVTLGLPTYFKYRKQAIINGDTSQMVEYFREGLSRAKSQQDGSAWSFNIINSTDDYYALVRDGATSTPVSITYLSTGVDFSASTTAGLFNITGGPTLTPLGSNIDIYLTTLSGEFTDQITVNTSGKITRTKNY
ncbi:MAG: type II secretion system protein [Candidatus Colwellbacteria bacterium]